MSKCDAMHCDGCGGSTEAVGVDNLGVEACAAFGRRHWGCGQEIRAHMLCDDGLWLWVSVVKFPRAVVDVVDLGRA